MLIRAIYVMAGREPFAKTMYYPGKEHILELSLRNCETTSRNPPERIRVAVSEHISVTRRVLVFFSPILFFAGFYHYRRARKMLCRRFLAHELAHIRISDYLVNFCQMVIRSDFVFQSPDRMVD